MDDSEDGVADTVKSRSLRGTEVSEATELTSARETAYQFFGVKLDVSETMVVLLVLLVVLVMLLLPACRPQ